jgi:phosphate-selective porin OprO/OprP
MVYGPFSVQTEYLHACVNAEDNQGFHGFYIYGSYVLTGEHRSYNTGRGFFETVEPKRKFDPFNGDWGAWEVGLRYSLLDLEHLDLEDEEISGGRLHGVTAGLNWYLNKHVRLMANYTRSDREGVGTADIVQSRLQVEF